MEHTTTTVELDREVVRAAKVCAAEEGITLKAYVERSLAAYITRWPKLRPRPPQAQAQAPKSGRSRKSAAGEVRTED